MAVDDLNFGSEGEGKSCDYFPDCTSCVLPPSSTLLSVPTPGILQGFRGSSVCPAFVLNPHLMVSA